MTSVRRSLVPGIVTVAIVAAFSLTPVAQNNRDVPLNVTSDGDALYFLPSLSVSNGEDLVSAVIRNEINVFVNLGSSNGRSESPRDLCVNLTMPEAGVSRGIVCQDLQSNSSGSENMRSMAMGQVHSKRFQVTWRNANGTYWLRFGDDAGTNRVATTCTATDVIGCSEWTMSPEGGSSGSIARLTFLSSARKSVTVTLGDYHVPFVWIAALQ